MCAVEPSVGGAIDAARLPVEPDDSVSVSRFIRMDAEFLGPHEHVSRGPKHEQYGPGRMVVGLVIDARGPVGDMSNETVIRHLEAGESSLGLFVGGRLHFGGARIGNKISLPDLGFVGFIVLVLGFEVVFLPVETRFEAVIAIEDKFRVAE